MTNPLLRCLSRLLLPLLAFLSLFLTVEPTRATDPARLSVGETV